MYIILKRIFDIILSLFVLILFFPFGLIIAFIIVMDSKGSPFFTHQRCGKNGKPIGVIKFRTMFQNASMMGPSFTLPRDQRITRVGKYLRRWSFDEIPQFINVFKGDMSIIGPRPRTYREELTEIEWKELQVKPGITGMAQVNGRSRLTKEEKNNFNLYYVDHISFLLDLKIFIKTFIVVLHREGINSELTQNRDKTM